MEDISDTNNNTLQVGQRQTQTFYYIQSFMATKLSQPVLEWLMDLYPLLKRKYYVQSFMIIYIPLIWTVVLSLLDKEILWEC